MGVDVFNRSFSVRPRSFAACALSISVASATLLLPPAHAHLSLIRQGPESSEAAETDERFGEAVAVGDFDGDGFDDLATGAPGEDNAGLHGDEQHGVVVINKGSELGLTHVDAYQVNVVFVDANVRFGQALAVGNFNGDEYDDLAVGAPFLDAGAIADAGAVYVFSGSAGGLTNPPLVLTQPQFGGSNQASDWFGWALAAGDFSGDGVDDLAVGARGEDNKAGAVFFLLGSDPGGLDIGTAGFFKQGDLGQTANDDEAFGHALSIGQLIGDSTADLAVGAPLDISDPGQLRTGRVTIVPGSASGLTALGSINFNAAELGLGGNDLGKFGWALAIGRIAHSAGLNGALDLAVGEPGQIVDGFVDAGRVVIYQINSPAIGLDIEDLPGTSEMAELQDLFGWGLGAGDLDADGFDELAVGVPFKNRGAALESGGVSIFSRTGNLFPGPSSTTLDGDWLFDENRDLELGYSFAYGAFDATGNGAFAIGSPQAAYKKFVDLTLEPVEANHIDEAGQVHVYAPHRQVFQLRSRSTSLLNCNDDIVFSQRMFDPLPIASTTKIMSNWIASDLIANSQMAADSTLPYVVPLWLAACSIGSEAGLTIDEPVTLIDLMKMMMAVSGNDAAYAVGDRASGAAWVWPDECSKSADEIPSFIDMMNTRAGNTGMISTTFTNAAGLDWPLDGPTPRSTAFDMALLTRGALQNPIFRYVAGVQKWTIDRLIFGFEVSSDFSNGQLNILRQKLPGVNVTSYKPGGTPKAKRTGVASANQNGEADCVAAMFGIDESDQLPDSNAEHAWRDDKIAELISLGLNSCPANPGGVQPIPVPPEPAVEKNAIPSTQNEEHRVVTDLGLVGNDMLVEVYPHHIPEPDAEFELCARRTYSFLLEPGQDITVSVTPFQRQDGIQLSNDDTTAVQLQITHNQPLGSSFALVLPGQADSLILGPTSARAGGFTLTLLNNSAIQPATLSLREERFCFDAALGPLVGDFSVSFSIAGNPSYGTCEFQVGGRDTSAVNLVRLIVREPGVPVPTDVVDPQDWPATQTAGSAVASLRVTPNPPLRDIDIEYALSRPAVVSLAVYDVAGRLVKRLQSAAPRREGRHLESWDGRNTAGERVAAGVYFLRISSGGDSQVNRIVLLR